MSSSSSQCSDDRVSLVDLAAVFVRRFWVFVVIFLVVTAGGVVLALVAPDVYRYSSVYLVGENDGEPLQKPSTIIAALENQWIPTLGTTFYEREGEALPVEFDVSNPDDTKFVRITSEASADTAEVAMESHDTLLSDIEAGQERQFEKQETILGEQIQRTRETIKQLNQSQGASEAMAVAFERLSTLQSQKASMEPGEVLVRAQKSAKEVGLNSKLIVILSIVFAGFLGLFGVFFVEFAGQVQRKLHNELN